MVRVGLFETNWSITMAAPKPYYATIEEAQAYLKSEGFEQMNIKALWKCDMSDTVADDVIVTIQGKAPAGYCIKELKG
jgi:hypothetical protein